MIFLRAPYRAFSLRRSDATAEFVRLGQGSESLRIDSMGEDAEYDCDLKLSVHISGRKALELDVSAFGMHRCRSRS